MQGEERLIRTIWPLPGGNAQYLDTLNRIVKWVASAENVTFDQLADWTMSKYNVSEKTVANYLRVVFTMQALGTQNGWVRVTRFGEQLLEVDGQAKARLVAERFLRDYLGFREVLWVYASSGSPVHLNEMVERLMPAFPRWTSSIQYEFRALWLLSLGCLEQVQGRSYTVTHFGQEMARQYPPLRDLDKMPVQLPKTTSGESSEMTPADTPVKKQTLEELLQSELLEAATDSQNPMRFEQAIAKCFEYLGFDVDHLGSAGETDVIARANIGDESYVVVIDAKARGAGKVHELNVFTLVDHRKQNQADYALVVAGEFAGGKVARHAEEHKVVLMPVQVLNKLLGLHARTPLSLAQYRTLFSNPGLLHDLPAGIEVEADAKLRWSHLVVDLMELLHETYQKHGLNESLPRGQMFYMLMTRLRGVRYSKEEVDQVIDFLAHPAVSAISAAENQVNLVMDRTNLARALRAMALQIETIETETQN